MADETQPDPPRRPPVKMGLRVVARHSAGRQGGRTLAHEVAEARVPKHLAASTRLARHPAPPPPPAPAVPSEVAIAREAALPEFFADPGNAGAALPPAALPDFFAD